MDAARPPLPLSKAGLAAGCASSSGPAPVRLGCSCPVNFRSPHAFEPCLDCRWEPRGWEAGREEAPHGLCPRPTPGLPTTSERRAAPAPTFPVGAELRQNEGKTLCNEPFC